MNPPVRLTQQYLQARRKKALDAMAEKQLDGLLLTHPGDLAWLTDFSGHDSIGLLSTSDFLLVTDFRYKEQADLEAPWLKQVIREGKMSEALADAIATAGIKRVG